MGKSNRKNKRMTVSGTPETAQEPAEPVASPEEGTMIEAAETAGAAEAQAPAAAEVAEGAEATNGAEAADGVAPEAAVDEPAENVAAEEGAEPAAEEGGKRGKKRAKGKRGKKRGKHRKLKMIIGICTALALCGTGLGIGLMFIPKPGLVINEGYGSVSYVVEEGETFSPDKHYTGLEIFGKLNWTFQQQDEWYSSYQGYVYTTVNQDVKTFKQFKDGRLISADITTSSLVNVARQFCYIPAQDRVIWREASGGKKTYDGFNTPWSTGKPKGNMTISGADGFKAKNGLPATELSVYVFQEDTILETEPVVDNHNGTYTVTYHLNPKVWKGADGSSVGAPSYYCNQMKFTGGLTDVPSFESITISFTFNEKWENLKTEAHEKYSATMGFTVGCKADGITEFSYDTPYLDYCDDYETYFKQYADMDATGGDEPTIDQMSAIASAFAPVINGPTTLSLDLTVGGKPVNGVIYVDLGTNGAVPSFGTQEEIERFIDTLKVRAKIGNVELYVSDGAAYVQADKLKLKLTVSELTDLLGGLLGGGSEAENVAEVEGEEEEEASPLDALMNAVLNHEKGSGKANAHADLELGGLKIPIDFNYFIDEEKLTASLDNVHTAFTVEGVSLAATLGFTDKAAPEAPADTSDFVELADHVKNIVALIEGGNLHADIQYSGYGLDVKGGVDISFAKKADGELTDEQKKEKVKVTAELTVSYGGKQKVVGIAYAGASDIAYLDLDGVKLSADVNEAAALVKKFLALTKDESGEGKDEGKDKDKGFSIPELVDTLLFTKAITDNLSVTDGEAATEILLKADALIGALGFDLGSFSLGDLSLTLSGKEISLASPTLGASIALKEGKDVTLKTDGYTDLANFVNAVSSIVDAGYLQAQVSYSGNGITVSGDLNLNIKDFKNIAAAGTFRIAYNGTEKALSIVYTGGRVSLDLDGVKLSADASEAVDIVKGFLVKDDPAAQGKSTLDKVLEKVFAFTFGEIITAEQTKDAATLTVQGTELLKLLGLGDVKIGAVTLGAASDGTIDASASGVTITAKAGTQFTAADPGYADVTGFAQAVADLIKGGYLAADVEFEGYGLTVTGDVTLDIKDFKDISAKGALTVTYGEAQKKLALVYTGGNLYLDLDGLKLAANVNEAVQIVKSFLAKDEPAAEGKSTLDKVLEKVFAFTFGDKIQVVAGAKEGDLASLTVQGTELLKLFDIDFKLGNVALNVTEGVLGVSAQGGDIDVTLTAQTCGDPQISAPADYVNLTEYAQAIAKIIHDGFVSAELTASAYGLGVSGTVSLDIRDFNNISAQGALNISQGDVSKALTFVYTGGNLYLGLDGLKLAANVNEAIAIVKGFLPEEKDKTNAGDGAQKSTLEKVLEKVFAFSFGGIALTGKDDAVSLAVDGTELLGLFGVEFDLGNVTLDLKKDGVAAAAKDGEIELGLTAKGCADPKIAAPQDYVDLTEYAKAIAKIVETGYIAADLSLTYGGLTVTAENVQLDVADFSNISAQATLTVTYGKFTKEIDVTYTGGVLYLAIGNMKLKVSVSEAVSLIGDIVAPKQDAPADGSAKSDREKLEETLQKVFSVLSGGALGTLEETKAAEGTADTVSLTVNGTKLLEALGVKFNPGNVTLDLTKQGVSVKAEGGEIGVTVKAEGRESVSIDAVTDGDYASLSPVLKNLATVLSKEAVCINGGSINVTAGIGEEEVTLTLNLNRGVISWAKDEEGKSKLNVYLDAALIVLGTEHRIRLNLIAGEKVVFAYGDELGVEIPLDDSLSSIENALLSVYDSIRTMVGDILGAETENPLKEIESVKDLGKLLLGALGAAAGADATSGAFDWTELLSKLELGNGSYSNSIAHVGLSGLSLDILGEVEGEEPGWLAVALGYTGEVKGVKIEVSGELHVNTFDEETVPALSIGEMPITIKAEEINTFLGYLGSAIELFKTTDLTLEFTGKVTSTDPAYQTSDDNNGVKYTVDAKMETHRGAANIFHLDVDGKNFWVDTDVFAHASINVKATNEKDTSLYIDLFILDGALDEASKTPAKTGEGKAVQDGELDFYVTVSQLGDVNSSADTLPGYNPVRLYAPSGEILTLLSSAVTMLGADAKAISPILGTLMDGFVGGLLNDYMVSKWITDDAGEVDTAMLGRLQAFGKLIAPLLSGLLNKNGAATEPAPETAPAPETEAGTKQFKLTDYLKALHIGAAEAEGKTELSVTLNSNGVYGREGLEDVKAILIKTDDAVAEDGTITYGKFETFDLLNIYGNNCVENTTLHGAITYGEVPQVLPEGQYQSFLGADDLILALVKSATHVSGQSDGADTYALNDNFYIDGTINIKVLTKNVTVKMALFAEIDKNNDLGVTLHVEYSKESLLVEIFKSAGWVDVTIKNGMVYIKRITDPDDDAKKEEIYRMMPVGNFLADILNQVDFIFNFGDTISNTLKDNAGGSGGSGGSGAAAKQDFGTQLATYLKSYQYTLGGGESGGALWNLVLNGSALASVLSDINIDLKSSGSGVLRGIGASLTVASILDLKADLRYRNPQNVMDDGVKNVVDTDVPETLDAAMSTKVKETDWSETTYLEGQLGSVTYTVGGKVVHEQDIVYDMQTKKFYSELKYPSFDDAPAPAEGYHWEWPTDTQLTPKTKIAAKSVPNTYHFTFKSEYQIEDYDEREGIFIEEGEYTYGQDFDLHLGTRARGDGFVKQLIGFKCNHGHTITSLSDWQHFAEEDGLELTAVWEDVEFTVTFDVNGTQTSVTGKFGDAITPPEGYETAKEGYSFTAWDREVPDTFSEDAEDQTYTAKYEPKTFEITFVSEHPVEWKDLTFTMCNEGEHSGKYVAKYTFTYDSVYDLPVNVRTEDGGFILVGWTKDGTTYKDRLPNVLDGATFTAVWDVVGVDVYFDGVKEPRNKQVGSSLTKEDLPEVPHRDGYTGEWDIAPDYTVPESGDGEDGKIVIKAKYTPITYVIYQYSLYPLVDYADNGFTKVDGEFESEGVTGNAYYVRKLFYVYGSNTVTLENGKTLAHHTEGLKKDGFDFMGFYTERFGVGEHIETINDDTIRKIFKFNVGNSEDFAEQNTIFAYWKNNAITVRFYSDIEGTLMEGYDGQGYFHDALYYDEKTKIDYMPTPADGGYQILAWFVQDGASWKMVTDAKDYRTDNNAVNDPKKPYDVALYAVWIESIDVQITEFKQVDIGVGYHYNIHGTVEGGTPCAGKSAEIYEALHITPTTTGVYVLHGRGNKSDKLLFGKEVQVTPKPDDPNVGTFGADDMNTTIFGTKFTDQADFGGMVMQMQFTFDGASVTMVDAAVISMATYTVTYHNKNGDVLQTVNGVHTNYTGTYNSSFFDNKFAINGKLGSSAQTYADELAASNKIDCPQTEEAGKTYIWPHREITGNMDIYPVYVTELQDVTFRADVKLDDRWEKEYADGQPTGKFIYKTKLYLEATVTYRDNAGEIRKDTVTTGENIFDLPDEIRSIGKRKGSWGATSFHYDPYGSTFTAEYGEDTVIYFSTIDFNLEYEGTPYSLAGDTEYPIGYQSTYNLWTPTREGYTFLGWFTKGADGKWSKVETLELGETAVTTKVEALWISDLKVTINSVQEVDKDWRWRFTSSVSVSGGELFGAFANEAVVSSMSYTHFANSDGNVNGRDYFKTNTYKEYRGTDSLDKVVLVDKISGSKINWKSDYHCAVSITYQYQGKDIVTNLGDKLTVEAVASVKVP